MYLCVHACWYIYHVHAGAQSSQKRVSESELQLDTS